MQSVKNSGETASSANGDDEASLRAAVLRNEQRFKALSNATAQIVSVSTEDGMLLGPQEQLESFTGQSAAESDGFGWTKALHPEDADGKLDRWKSAFRGSVPFRNEHRIRRADGTYRYFSFTATPIHQPDGTIREWLWVHSDVTQRRDSDEQTAKALRELNDVKAAIDEHAIVAVTDAKGRLRM
jgi:PAS domain S-box-containing protein